MAPKFTDTKNEYTKNEKLKKEDVDALVTWTNKQPHLPKITELQGILFLQSCYYSNEAAKNTIDTFFSMRTLCPELYREENPSNPAIRKATDNSLATFLPKRTPQGDALILLKLIHPNPENFSLIEHIKYFDMAVMTHLYQEGTSEGHIILIDMKDAAMGHLTRVVLAGPAVLKKIIFYVQEAMPIRLKGLHFFNIVPFMDKVMALIKPFIKKEILKVIYLHNTVDDLIKHVPLECLPKDYGGQVEPVSVLHENIKKSLAENADLFKWEDEQAVDESKRQKKFEKFDDVFGIEGTFKKLDID